MNKIVFVIGATKSGGAEKRAILISKILKDKYDTKVFAFHGENNGDIDYVYHPSYHEYKQTSKSERIKSLREYLVKEQPDFVFSFVPHINFFATKALKVKELENTKHIVGIVNIKNSFKSSLLLKYSIKRADAVYYQSIGQKLFIKSKCYSFALANPITIPELKEKEISYKMMSVGRLEDQKDYPLMIKAFEIISKRIPFATLDIYGSGSKKQELIELIKSLDLENKIRLVEYQENIKQFYDSHDVFLFTSKFEGFPNALAEAMANNLICFSTYFQTGLEDLIEDGKTGYICKNRDRSEFANLVANKLENHKELAEIKKNAYSHISDICSESSFKERMVFELDKIK